MVFLSLTASLLSVDIAAQVIAAQRKVIAEQNDRLEVIEDLLLQKGMKL